MTALLHTLHVTPAKAGVSSDQRPLPRRKMPALAGMTILWLLLLVLASPAFALDFPKFTGLVTDAAHVLPPDRAAALTAKLEAFQQKTGKQLVVATVPDLGGEDIQDYGYQLGRAWDVGLKSAGNGTILLVAPSDRKVGIETASGISGVLTDAYTSVVINSKILPAFKAGDLPGGVEAGTDALIDVLSTPDDQIAAKRDAAVAAWNKDHAHRGHQNGGVPWGVFVWLVIIGVVVLGQISRRARYGRTYGGGIWPILMWDAASHFGDRGGWGGGSFGGGNSSDGGGGGWMDGGFTGGGGGGGSFDGGGSSGSW